MEIILSIASKIAENLVEPVGRQFGYLCHCDRNIEALNDENDKLQEMRAGVQQLSDAAISSGKVLSHDVERWLRKVDKNCEELGRFLEHVKLERSSLHGWSPNLKSRYFLSRKAKKKTGIVVKLREEWNTLDRETYPAPPPNLGSTFTGGFKSFQSREIVMGEVMEVLRSNKINMISICGLGGVGKTTMVKEIIKRAEAENRFDKVVVAKVSQNPNFLDIQQEIADGIGFKLEPKALYGRAIHLHGQLRRIKRILIVFDDVWEKFSLEEIGIPSTDQHQGCKILLTSRNEDVCCKMNNQKNFTVGILSELETWKFFMEVAGTSVNNPGIQPLAKEVAMKCGGLPIIILILGNALRGKEKHIWEDVVRQLQNSNKVDNSEMQNEVYLQIELSYDYLRSEDAKLCFLLCCLFPEDFDIPIEYLVRYGMGLRLFHSICTLEEVRNRVHALVEKLKKYFLLLESGKAECVKLHDIVRKTALSIASKSQHKFLVRHDAEREWLREDKYGDYMGVSIVCDKMYKGVDGLDSSRLKFLQLLSMNCTLGVKSPDLNNAFKGMEELRVLALLNMPISSLPSSLQVLGNLSTLCLDHCCFGATFGSTEDLSVIGTLVNLEILSFSGSDILELPQKLENLSHLRLLDLTACASLRKIPAGILSRLTQLEELYMRNSFSKWEFASGEYEGKTNASIAELSSLSGHLKVLDIHVTEINLLAEGLLFRNLKRFNISIGSPGCETGTYLFRNYLRIDGDVCGIIWRGIHELLKKTEILYLQVESLKNVLSELDTDGFLCLKELSLVCCYKLECIIDTGDWAPHVTGFPLLESLSLRALHNLREIWHEELPKSPSELPCFGNLRSLKIFDCNKLKYIFSLSIARGLVHLEYLDCSRCGKLREVISRMEGEDLKAAEAAAPDSSWFPKLTYLELDSLSDLISFCQTVGDDVVQKSLNHQFIWQEGLTGFDQSTTASSEKIQHGKIQACTQLELVFNKLFTSIWMQQLLNLEQLVLKGCDSLEVVFDLDDQVNGALSCLKELELHYLTKLRHVWKHTNGIQGFQNLRALTVKGCKSLKSLFSLSIVAILANLQELEVTSCEGMEEIIAKAEDVKANPILFPQLNSLKLVHLPNLINFSSEPHAFEWPLLKKVTVRRCPRLNIFGAAGQCCSYSMTPQPLFHAKAVLHMEILQLSGLDSLTRIGYHELPEGSLCKLREIEVEDCENLLNVVHSSLTARLQKLEKLVVCHCASIVEIFESQTKNEVEKYTKMVYHLEEVILMSLPKLLRICNSPREIWCFQQLRRLEVYDCGNLRSILSPLLASSLQNLQIIKIYACEMLEKVIAQENEELQQARKNRIVFHQLKLLELVKLPNLKRFCDGIYAVELPLLGELVLKECPEIKAPFYRHLNAPNLKKVHINSSEYLLTRDLSAEVGNHFKGKVTLDKLEILHVSHVENLRSLGHDQIPDGFFCELREMEVKACENLLNVIPSNIEERFLKLEKLTVHSCASLVKIFESEGVSSHERLGGMFFKLKKLNLTSLPELAHVLNNPRIPSFQHLESLNIDDCSNLRSIFSPSVAASLQQLKIIKISNCKLVEDIIGKEDGKNLEATVNKIVFPELWHLTLENLPNFTGFCWGVSDFELPSFDELIVVKCPKMKLFTYKFVSTPKLEKVCIDSHYCALMGDLNATISYLFKGKV
ncbi:probable disease resistance protein At4g27220 [Jatropha curcas]|uniref:probable disease resistance protein At4g27220 n=1 Tax=Jatropha curcas TaxID=180498 RepID=UPI0009D680FD|nr:probable disease resistance protein At4g27220 [Jatropha curcas]